MEVNFRRKQKERMRDSRRKYTVKQIGNWFPWTSSLPNVIENWDQFTREREREGGKRANKI